MAEKGAHLTGTTFTRPSIFEIIAQESFASTVEPAFKKFFSYIISFNIERYGHLLRWADEAASFSEAFYSLKCISVVNSKVKHKLSKEQKKLSIILIKFEKLYHTCVTKGSTIIFMVYEFMVLYNYVLYVSGKSVYTSPLLRLLSVTLTYAEPQPIVSVSDLLRKIKHNSFGINDGIHIFQRMVTTSLEFGAFFLQFLSWWTQEHYSINLLSLPIPPPPKIPETAKQYKGTCPICHKALRVHTVLSVSGYAFCYQCILPVIRKDGKCPVTNYPAKEDDLIRLYLE
ncbi:Peroxisome assembly protein 12 [Habropoda laboriosa]|uniref:Peroxisome assembly protein 12 n=1 Tax=Habropoda laboriosa TaxID=597456 RepID=A0A0L7RAR2_9HYME|nr:Peroxisome assembly protein 12 [Habropoda laboriosa]